jgi:hypothetical protein
MYTLHCETGLTSDVTSTDDTDDTIQPPRPGLSGARLRYCIRRTNVLRCVWDLCLLLHVHFHVRVHVDARPVQLSNCVRNFGTAHPTSQFTSTSRTSPNIDIATSTSRVPVREISRAQQHLMLTLLVMSHHLRDLMRPVAAFWTVEHSLYSRTAPSPHNT